MRRYQPLVFIFTFVLFAGSLKDYAAVQAFDPSLCASAAQDRVLSEDCKQMIVAFPRPDVKDIEQDFATINKYNFWKVVPDAVDTYDAPNGKIIGQIAKGFNFVNVVDESNDGWLKTQDSKWIKRGNASPTKASLFHGVTLPADFQFPFAWVLDKSQIYASEYPGGPSSAATKRVLRRGMNVSIYLSLRGIPKAIAGT